MFSGLQDMAFSMVDAAKDMVGLGEEEEVNKQTEAEKAVEAAGEDEEELEGENEEELGGAMVEGEETLLARDDGEEALQLDHQLDPGKFHVGVKWVHLAGLTGNKEQYNGQKFMVVSFGVKDPSKVKVRSAERNPESGKYRALWVRRVNCRNTVHQDNGFWTKTENPENTGATGAARWVALGRSQVDAMQGKLKFRKTPEEDEARAELFRQADVNNNGMISLAELDKALPELFGCVALFNAKPAIIRAFLAATNRPPDARSDEAAYQEHKADYIYPGEQFRVLIQYLHDYFEMYLMFQDLADVDADRRIDCKEWAEFITSGKAEKIGIKVTPEILEDMCGETPMPGYSLFNEIDVDQGGCILFKEFSDYAIRKGLKNPDRVLLGGDGTADTLRELFASAKDLPDGMSLGKFHTILTKIGTPADDIDEMIRQADKNRSYAIDVDEFVDWLMDDEHRLAFERAQKMESGDASAKGERQQSDGARPVCKMGCGMLAADGVSRSGRPMETCCRGCAKGGDHDSRCSQDAA
eukprot:TRINITY_DN76969_c0_g1_i1.p1 TRINITY_DN76969_c0_g1~~TRINITY_DN76969_c0_g1_i1.p1  ORF type:complete len:526 (-),score=127.80 TRINITY_DN76969_c0_g1_i1:257-1834(-)